MKYRSGKRTNALQQWRISPPRFYKEGNLDTLGGSTQNVNLVYSVGSYSDETNSDISQYRYNSPRSMQFASVYEAIRKMAKLPPGHSFHLDPAAARKAEDLLASLAGNFDIEPPKIAPHEGEALIMTWDADFIKQLVTVANDGLDLVSLNKRSRVYCDYEIDLDEPGEMRNLLVSLGRTPVAQTNSD